MPRSTYGIWFSSRMLARGWRRKDPAMPASRCRSDMDGLSYQFGKGVRHLGGAQIGNVAAARLQHPLRHAPGAPTHRVRVAEQRDDWLSQPGGEMQRAAVRGHNDIARG